MTEVIKVEDCGENIGDYDVPIYNAILIPDNATNGDILKIIFDCKTSDEEENYIESDTVVRYSLDGIYEEVSKCWWNAPYKAESGEDE